MDRAEKQQFIEKLKSLLSKTKLVVLIGHKGLTVSEASNLRIKMRSEGASYVVAKNTLAKIALSDTEFNCIADLFRGQTAIAMSESPVTAAKVAVEFAKNFEERFEVMAGCMDGRILSVAEVKALAALPPVDELRSKMIAIISAPAQKIAAVLQAPAGQLARVFGAYSSKV